MKLLHFIIFTIFLTTSTLNANNLDLKHEIKILKEENIKQQEKIRELISRVDELDDSIESVETKTLIDKVNIRLGFHSQINNFYKKFANGKRVDSKNIDSTKFMLNLDSDITETMKFNGRLSMYKYWADSTKHLYSQFDNMQGRVPSDSSLFVERAYIDWYFARKSLLPSAITIGRQPSADGPSHQFKANTKRKSTYSALVFDGASDGIVTTTDLSKVIPIKKSKLRFAYGKGFQKDETSGEVTNAFLGSNDTTIKDTDVLGLFFESSILNTKNTLFQIGYVTMSDMIANSMESGNNINIGDVSFIGAMLESKNFKDSPLDIFAHVGYSQAKPNGKIYQYANHTFSLLGNKGNQDTKEGYAFWLGGRYTFSSLNSSKIGLEYNKGSKNWLTATQGSYDLHNKLSTRGEAYEAYYIYPINRYSFIKLGALYIDYKYTNSGWYLGEAQEISNLTPEQKEYTLDSMSNISLQFSLNF